MAFSVDIKNDDAFAVVHLKNEAAKTIIEIYAFGALLNAFIIHDSINIIDGNSSPQDAVDNITNGFKSAKLSPYVCRTANGKFEFEGKHYKIGKFFLGKEAIHGLLYDAIFNVVEHGADNDKAFVTLQYHFKSKEGFPFNYICIVQYTLEKNNQLSITTTIKNKSENEMPLCDGWHPYFTLAASVDELMFEMNANKMLEFNERLLPTGKISDYNKFQTAEAFANTSLDNCFLLNDTNKPACVLKNQQTGLQLIVQPDNSYPYLQVFTPPHRESVAIENLSAAPDAFNNKMGLKILKLFEEAMFKTSYTVMQNL